MARDPKLLTEDGWRQAARGTKLPDKDLRRALADYADAAEEDHDERLASLAKVVALAGTLKKHKDLAEAPELGLHLGKLLSAAQAEQRELEKARSSALRDAAKAEAEDDEAQAEDEEEADDDQASPYEVKLTKALDKLKKAKKPFHFVVCQAKPYCIVQLSPSRVTSAQLKTLIEVSGGSKLFLKPGTCTRDGNRLTFDMPNPPPGLARRIAKSLRHFTGKKLVVAIGEEVAEDDGEAEVEAPEGEAARPARIALEKTPEVWNATQRVVRTKVDQLKAAVRKAFATEGAGVVAEVERSVQKLDAIFEQLDDDLAELLAEAAAATDAAARQAALQGAKALLAEHIQFVKSEPMIAHIDSNPFDVATDLQGTLTKSLKHLVQAIGPS